MNAITVTTNRSAPQLMPQQGGQLQDFTPSMFTAWISYLDASPKTIETYTRNIRPFAYYLEATGTDQPTRADVLQYRDTIRAKHKPATVQAYITAVKLFFSWTAQAGIYPNIAEKVKGAKTDPEHKKDYLTAKQVTRLFSSIDSSTLKGKRDFAILALMITSGMRTIEISRADVGDLQNIADFTALFVQGKGHDEKSDFVKVAEPVEKAIRDYLTARGKAKSDEPLFTSDAHRNAGERMTTRSISRIVKEHLKAAGFDSDRLTAHSMRHTAATLNLLNGGTIEETRQLLRHTNINTTLIYSHALERAKNNSENRIANAIFG